MPRVKKKAFHHLPLSFIFVLALGVAATFFWFFAKSAHSPTIETELPGIVPTATPDPKIGTVSQPSPDGKVTLIRDISASESGELMYSLSVQEKDKEHPLYITQSSLKKDENIHVPFNTWSPNNKYFFVEVEDSLSKRYQIFSATGTPIKTEQFLDVNQDFFDKEIPFRLTEATGWASPTLLIIQTEEQETGERGPSYWYEIPTRNFIRLSSSF